MRMSSPVRRINIILVMVSAIINLLYISVFVKFELSPVEFDIK